MKERRPHDGGGLVGTGNAYSTPGSTRHNLTDSQGRPFDATAYLPATARIIGHVTNRTSQVLRTETLTWNALTAMLVPTIGRKDGFGWVPADIPTGDRKQEHVRSVSYLCLDIEAQAKSLKDAQGQPLLDSHGDVRKKVIGNEPPAIDDLAGDLEMTGWRAALHTTYGHTAEHARYRLILDLSRPLQPDELRPLGLHVAELLGLSACVDTSCLEPARLYYLPRCPAERLPLFQRELIVGSPLDVDDLLRDLLPVPEADKHANGNGVDEITVAWVDAHTDDPERLDHLRDALGFLDADNYGVWISGGMAAKSLGAPAREIWMQWSATSGKFDAAEASRKWGSFQPTHTSYRAVFAQAQRAGWVNPLASTRSPSAESSKGPASAWPAPLDLRELARRDPEPPRFIIEDWLPVGYATLIAGHGGAGKSSIALYLAACIALGLDFFGLPTKARRVLYASCEDRADILHWRLSRICAHLGIELADLAGELVILDLVGRPVTLWERGFGGATVTSAYHLLANAIDDHDAPVVFIDGVADVFGGNENDRGEVKRFVNALVGLISPDTGALGLIHHVNKSVAGTATSEGYSGSTGWHNSVRARWYLYPETEATEEGVDRTGRLLLELQKSNLGKADQTMTFSWDEGAHLFVGKIAGGAVGKSRAEQHARDEIEREGIIAAFREVESTGDYVPAAMQGSRTAYHVLTATKSFPETLKNKPSIKRFRRHIEDLRRIHIIVESSMRRPNRHAAATLTLKPAPDVGCAALPNTHDENATPIRRGAPCAELPNSAGGYGGRARAECPKCLGDGCAWCQPKKSIPKTTA